MPSKELAIRPLYDGETLEDIQSELSLEDAAKIEAETQENFPEPDPIPEIEMPERQAGMVDTLAAALPSKVLNLGWKRFDLGKLTPEQVSMLDAATLAAMLKYKTISLRAILGAILPERIIVIIENIIEKLGHFKDVAQLMAVFTYMQFEVRKAERARDVTPAREDAPAPAPDLDLTPEVSPLDAGAAS